MDYERFQVSRDATHHLVDGRPAYARRFICVGKFHPPGLAPVSDESGWYHILPDGTAAYSRRFRRAFGFYESRAAVISEDGWHHILQDGSDLYKHRYSWTGNFQEGRCTVRERDGLYRYISLDGSRLSDKKYLYAGDFRDGIAVVRELDGLCTHIDKGERPVHGGRFLDLDVYHKGYARARDSWGWFHVDLQGRPVYESRFLDIEPFYNGCSMVMGPGGERFIIDEFGDRVHTVLGQHSPVVQRSLREKLMRMLVGYWETQIIYSIVRLGILDRIKEGHDSFERLRTCLDIPEPSLNMILRVLLLWNFISDKDGRYQLEYLGNILTEGSSGSLRNAAIMWGEEHYTVMSRLYDALREYEPQFDTVFGEPFFQYLSNHKERGVTYNRAMEEYGMDYEDILPLVDFSEAKVVADVGGGTGKVLRWITQAHSHIRRAILFDLPSVIDEALPALSNANQNPIELVKGNFFSGLPFRADTILLGRVLHDWKDKDARRILTSIRGSLENGGRLVILEILLPEKPNLDLGMTLAFDLLVTVGGKERTLAEFDALLASAGFKIVEVKRGEGILSAIIAKKVPR